MLLAWSVQLTTVPCCCVLPAAGPVMSTARSARSKVVTLRVMLSWLLLFPSVLPAAVRDTLATLEVLSAGRMTLKSTTCGAPAERVGKVQLMMALLMGWPTTGCPVQFTPAGATMPWKMALSGRSCTSTALFTEPLGSLTPELAL